MKEGISTFSKSFRL